MSVGPLTRGGLDALGRLGAHAAAKLPKDATPQQRRAAAADQAAAMLEGLFMRQLMKVMRKSVPESALFGKSSAMDIYTDMFDGAIVDKVSQGRSGFGLREELVRQLSGGAAAPMPSPARAAALMRKVAAMGVAGGAMELLTQHGKNLGGIAFEAPNRPHAARLTDADGKLRWPIDGTTPASFGADGTMPAAGGAEVLAAGSGQVVSADASSLVLAHGNGLRTWYRGLGQVQAQTGDQVLRGQVLGTAGQHSALAFGATRGGQALNRSEIATLATDKNDPTAQFSPNAR